MMRHPGFLLAFTLIVAVGWKWSGDSLSDWRWWVIAGLVLVVHCLMSTPSRGPSHD